MHRGRGTVTPTRSDPGRRTRAVTRNLKRGTPSLALALHPGLSGEARAASSSEPEPALCSQASYF
eukprot:1751693-Rhodomonas_salina.1